jgi:hypothetical protein
VSETSDGQLAVFPSDDAYCGAEPTEYAPFSAGPYRRRSVTRRRRQPSYCFDKQRLLQRRGVPHAASDEVMKLDGFVTLSNERRE